MSVPRLNGIAEVVLLAIALIAGMLALSSLLPTTESPRDPTAVQTAWLMFTIAVAGLACSRGGDRPSKV